MAKRKIWWGLLFRVLAMLFAAAPLSIWLFINRVKYFTPRHTTNMMIGMILGLVFILLVVVGVFKNMNKKTTIYAYLTIALALVWFLSPLMKDLFWVILSILAGYTLFLPLWAVSGRLLKHYHAYAEEKVRVQARKEADRDVNEVFM